MNYAEVVAGEETIFISSPLLFRHRSPLESFKLSSLPRQEQEPGTNMSNMMEKSDVETPARRAKLTFFFLIYFKYHIKCHKAISVLETDRNHGQIYPAELA